MFGVTVTVFNFFQNGIEPYYFRWFFVKHVPPCRKKHGEPSFPNRREQRKHYIAICENFSVATGSLVERNLWGKTYWEGVSSTDYTCFFWFARLILFLCAALETMAIYAKTEAGARNQAKKLDYEAKHADGIGRWLVQIINQQIIRTGPQWISQVKIETLQSCNHTINLE